MYRKGHYDIILIFPNFRRNAIYLSIIKYLSKDFTIGLLRVPVDNSAKTFHTDRLFLHLCKTLGAEILQADKAVSTNILIIPQWPYSQAAISIIKNTVKEPHKTICTCALTWAGLHDDLLKTFDIHKIFMIDRNLFSFLLKQRGIPHQLNQEIIEIGLPFERYPVFDQQPSIDYLIAMPTAFSFPQEVHKISFLKNVLKIVDDILATNIENVIAVKKHNAVESQYLFDHKSFTINSFLCKWRLTFLTRFLSQHGSFRSRFAISSLYHNLLSRTVPLSELTMYSDLPLEIFLPFVKKGIIGGLSNTMWATLFFKKPFYNCIPDSARQQLAEQLVLKTSLEYFGVPYSNGALEFDSSCFDKISDETRKGDLIETLRRELN